MTPTDEQLYAESIKHLNDFKRNNIQFISLNMLQRKLLIGYTPVAKVLERLENEGYVSAIGEDLKREILR